MSIDPVFVNLCVNEIIGNVQQAGKTINDLYQHLVCESETLLESDMLKMVRGAQRVHLEAGRQLGIVGDALRHIHRLTPEVLKAKVAELKRDG